MADDDHRSMPTGLYRKVPREANQEFIRRALHPSDPLAMLRLCAEYVRNFHPSLFAELDWQEFRPDLTVDDTRQILEYIDDFVFFYALLPNIAARHPGNPRKAFTPADLRQYETLFSAWQQGWLGPERSALLTELDAYVEAVRRPYWTAAETAIRIDAEKALTRGFSALTDIRRLDNLVEVILSNARYRYLDLPWTRRRAKAAVRIELTELGDWSLAQAGLGTRADPRKIARRLRVRAEVAHRVRLTSWASLLEWAAEEVDRLDPASLDRYEGDWGVAMSPCGQCSMWFTLQVVSSMDTTCSFMNWSDRGLVFIPAGIGTAECPFCGLVAPVDSPAMFYAEQRNQVVYLIPTKGMLSETDAAEFWRPTIEGIRERYTSQLDAISRQRFEEAGELITANVKDFLYAIQMGETIPEDHVYVLIRLPDGSGLIFDGEKRFARIITPAELNWFTATGHVDQYVADSSADVYNTIAQLLPEGQLDITQADFVETALSHLADVNDAIDAVILEAQRRRE